MILLVGALACSDEPATAPSAVGNLPVAAVGSQPGPTPPGNTPPMPPCPSCIAIANWELALLPKPQDGSKWAMTTGISDADAIVGYGSTPNAHRRAFRFTLAGSFTQLAVGPGDTLAAANGSSSNDYVAGSTTKGLQQAVRWGPTGSLTVIGGLEPGSRSVATDVNANGTVVGYGWIGARYSAFRWVPGGGGIQNLSPSFTLPSTFAQAVNAANQVVGHQDYDPMKAVMWDASGNVSQLGTLGGSQSRAWDINDNGLVVGWSETATRGENRYFAWTAQTGMVNLGVGGGDQLPLAVSNKSRIVGTLVLNGVERAFMKLGTKGATTYLNVPPGTYKSRATGVNTCGHVVGWIGSDIDGERPVLWRRSAIGANGVKTYPCD
jgi:probable HAF family extracellular repeat protein